MAPDNQFLFAQYGSGIPGTPVQPNYAPSRADAYMATQRASFGETMRMQLLASDPRAVNIANRLMDYSAGTGTSTQFSTQQSMQKAEAARMMQTMAGIGINHPMINPFSGGNILNAAVGQSAAFANSQMRFQGMGSGGLGAVNHFTGSGAATDMLTLAQMKSYNNHFVDSGTGLMRMNKAHGFGHSDLGEMQTYLGMSGAYSGMISGRTMMRQNGSWDDVRKQAEKMGGGSNILDAIDSAKADGRNVAFALDESSSNRMNTMLSDMAKTMKGLKNVFGGRPMAELMQIAEELTGGSFNSSSQFNRLSDRLESATAFSAATGIDTGAYLNQQVRVKQTLESYGMGSRVAAAGGQRVAQDSIIQYQSYKSQRNRMMNEQGVYMRDMSMQEFEAINMMDQKRLSDEMPEASLYALMVQNSTMSPEARAGKMKALKDSLAESTGTDNPREQARIQRQRISAAMQSLAEESGVSVSAWMKRLNASSMDEAGTLAQQFLGDQSSSALMGLYADEGRRRNIESLLPRFTDTLNLGGASGAESLAFTKSILTQIGTGTRGDLIKSLQSGGDWKGIIGNASLSEDAKQSVTSSIATMVDRLGGSGAVADSIIDITRNSKLDARMNNLRSQEDINIAKQGEMSSFFARKAFGGEAAAPSAIRSFAEGFLGADIMTAQDNFAFAIKGGAKATNWGTYNLETGGLTMSADQAKDALKGMTGTMRETLGLTGKDAQETLMNLVSTTEGLYSLRQAGRAEGLAYDVISKDGVSNVYSMNRADAESASERGRKMDKVAAYGAFYGKSYMDGVLDPFKEGGQLKEDADFDAIFKTFRLNVDYDKAAGNKRLQATRSQFAKLLDNDDSNDEVIMKGLGALGSTERETIFAEALRDANNLDNFSGDWMPWGKNAEEKQQEYIQGIKALRDEFRQASGQTYLGRLTIEGDALDLFRMGEDQ